MADFAFKVIVVGQSGVGKTAIVQRYVRKSYKENEHPTIGVDIGLKLLQINGYKIQLKIWDSAGSERFKSLTTSYYRNADAAVLVYGINNPKTLHELHTWSNEVSNRDSDMLKILVGNKTDLEERAICHQTAIDFAMMEKLDLAVECSAKIDDNIDYIFYTIAKKLMTQQLEKQEFNDGNNALNKKRTKTSENVVNYEGTSRSMENLFFSPRDINKKRTEHHETIELTTFKQKSIMQRICTIL